MKVSCLRVKSNLDAVVPKSELFQNLLCGCLREGVCVEHRGRGTTSCYALAWRMPYSSFSCFLLGWACPRCPGWRLGSCWAAVVLQVTPALLLHPSSFPSLTMKWKKWTTLWPSSSWVSWAGSLGSSSSSCWLRSSLPSSSRRLRRRSKLTPAFPLARHPFSSHGCSSILSSTIIYPHLPSSFHLSPNPSSLPNSSTLFFIPAPLLSSFSLILHLTPFLLISFPLRYNDKSYPKSSDNIYIAFRGITIYNF